MEEEGFLQPYRVLDITDERGHLCGRILGDFGADVIKIEPPSGDPSRNIGPFYHDQPHPEKSLYWFFANANKRGITLNLETNEGKRIFKQLVQKADLIIESFPPKYLQALELDYPSLARIKPDIILTSITPFGQDGPYAHYKVTDIVAVSMGGMPRLFGDEDRAPVRISLPQAYFLGSLHAAVGSIFALYHRELTGEGQHVDVSIHEAVVLSLMVTLEIWDLFNINYKRTGSYSRVPRPFPLGPLRHRRIFPCKDGHVNLLLIGGAQAGGVKSSRELIAWANKEGYAQELANYDWAMFDFATVEQSEVDSMIEAISPFLLTKTKAELFEEAIKRNLLLAPAATISDLAQNPQLLFRDFWAKLFHPELGDTLTYPGAPVKLSECQWRLHRRAPLIGEHNKEIYEGELGLSTEQLSLLKNYGVI